MATERPRRASSGADCAPPDLRSVDRFLGDLHAATGDLTFEICREALRAYAPDRRERPTSLLNRLARERSFGSDDETRLFSTMRWLQDRKPELYVAKPGAPLSDEEAALLALEFDRKDWRDMHAQLRPKRTTGTEARRIVDALLERTSLPATGKRKLDGLSLAARKRRVGADRVDRLRRGFQDWRNAGYPDHPRATGNLTHTVEARTIDGGRIPVGDGVMLTSDWKRIPFDSFCLSLMADGSIEVRRIASRKVSEFSREPKG